MESLPGGGGHPFGSLCVFEVCVSLCDLMYFFLNMFSNLFDFLFLYVIIFYQHQDIFLWNIENYCIFIPYKNTFSTKSH